MKLSALRRMPDFRRARDAVSVSRRLLGMIWDMDPKLFIGSLIVILIPAVIPFINAYIYKLLIDAVILNIAGAALEVRHLVILLIIRVATYFLQDASFSAQTYMERLLWTKFPIYLHQRLYTDLSQLDMETLENPQFRNTLEQVKESVYRPQNLITNLLYGCQSLVQLFIAFGALLALNWVFILLVLFVAIPEFVYRLYEDKAGWTIWAWHSPRKKRFSYVSHLLQDAQSVKEMRIFRLAPLFVREATEAQEAFYRENKALAGRALLFQILFNVLSTLLIVGIETYVILLAFLRRVTIGDISFYTSVVANFQNGLGGLLRNMNGIFESSLYVRSIFDVMDAPRHIVSPPDAPARTMHRPPSIVFDHVTFRYPGADRDVLHDFCVGIAPGEKVAFVGENGAGKTTIIKLLARFHDPTSGRILVDDKDLRELHLESWHQQLAVLFQDFNRYEDTAKHNIYFGNVLKAMDAREIERAAEDAGATVVIDTLKKGYDQMLGRVFESGEELSVGQWQKIALARAYFRNAPVLVLDEPTAAIDAKAEAEIFARVEELSQDKTVLLISHRFSTVRMADRIIVVQDGAVLEQGSHDALMKRKGLYAELFTLQAKGYR